MLRYMIAFLTLLSTSAYPESPFLSGTYEPVDGGAYEVLFTVHNSLEDDIIGRFFLTTTDASEIKTREGWKFVMKTREVEWSITDIMYAIQPGESVGGFGFIAQEHPGTLGWFIASSVWGYSGNVTPTLIPEPGSLIALGGGLAALGLPVLRRRRRQG